MRVSKISNMFALVKTEDEKVAICAGGYAVSEKKFDSFELADQYIAVKPYELIFNVVSLLIFKSNENKTKEPNKKAEENN